MRAASRPLALLLLALGTAPASAASLSPAPAAQGASREDRTAVQDLSAYTAGSNPDGLPRSVDLRPWLPEVGEQTMNDCAAWAFGYAGRSYLEAIDQGWKPDAPARIFSPTFIYNQVNQGVDQGSRVDRVLDLLMTRGAATLATAPYLARDFLTPPPAPAQEEATSFKIADFGVLPDGPWIRQALAEGYIVLCCVRTNPVFSSGRYPVYTRELHEKGQAARRPDQPHGYHAMAIVGYSDDRQAFLFMNSWGKDWGEGGFVWVAYDVLTQFNKEGIESELMDFAVVMFDRREPVARVDGRYQVLPLDELQASGFGAYSGYEPEAEGGAYRFVAAVRGAPELLERVASVEWTIPGPEGPRTISSTSAANGFRITARATTPSLSLTGVARLHSGHETPLSLELEVPEASKRQLALERVDSFHEAGADGDTWRWTLLPRMADTDWRDLESIRYEFDEPDGTAPPVYQHDGGLPPAWSPDSIAMPSFRSAAPRSGRALLRFRDGSEHELLFGAEPFSDPRRTALEREIVWRPVGTDGDRHWSFYELRIRYPEAWAEDILGIRIMTGNNVDWQSHEARPVSGPGPRMHVFHGYARRPFASSALAWFREPKPSLGRTTPVTDYQVHHFSPEAEWTIPELEDPDTLRPGHGFGIESEDRYLGLVDGVPTWELRLYLDGTANIMTVNEVEWTLPDGTERYSRDDDSNPGPLDGYPLTRQVAGPIPVRVTATLWNGESFTLERTVQPFAPRNDALGIDLTEITPDELRAAAPERALLGVALAGTPETLAEIRRIVAYPPRPWGGVLPTEILSLAFNQTPEAGREIARLEAPRDQPVRFVVHYRDGSALTLDARPHALAPAPALPRTQLLARERFAGWTDGQPAWELALELRGEHPLLAQVAHVSWEALPEHSGVAATVAPQAAGLLRAEARTNGECRIRATLQFTPESGIDPQTVEASVLGFSERLGGAPRVAIDRGWVWDPVERYGPNIDPFTIVWPPIPYRFRIEAGPAELAQIASVEWIVRDPWAEKYAVDNGNEPPAPEIHERDASTRASGFAWEGGFQPDTSTLQVLPRLHLLDGSTRELETISWDDSTEAREATPGVRATEVRDWGEVAGQRLALVIAGVPPGPESERILRVGFQFADPLAPAPGTPLPSFERPIARRAFLSGTPGTLRGFAFSLRQDHNMGFEEKDKPLRLNGGFTLPRPITTPTLGMETERGDGGSLWFLWVRAPESLLAQTGSVVWTVTQDGVAREIPVADRIGERRDGFELRLSGPRPSLLQAQLRDRQGAPLGEPLERRL